MDLKEVLLVDHMSPREDTDTTRQKQGEMSTYSDRAAEKAEIATEKS